MFVITGATGNTGSVAAHALLDAGQKVRVLARSAEKVRPLADRGAEVVVGDLWDRKSLEKALVGASGLYLLSPPDLHTSNFVAERKPLLEGVVATAKAAGVPHVVLLSSMGAELPEGTGPIRSVYVAEQALRASGIPSTFIRAAYFMENWGAVLPVAKKDGVLPTFLPAHLSMSTVATRDIGLTAARALQDGPRGVRILELSGPSELSPSQVAAVVSGILGREIRVVEAPLDAVVPTFTSFGISAHIAGLFREMYEAIAKGKVAWVGKGTEAIRGTVGLEETLRPMLG